MVSSQEMVKVALIGCGAVSQKYYAPALQALEKSRLLQVKVLYDPNEDSLAHLLQNFPEACCVRDLSQISALGIDLAIIASPPRYHARQALELLRTGIAVLCEKPIAGTVAEAQAMIETAAKTSTVLAVGLFRRFFPATQAIHKILSGQILGEIESFDFSEGGYFRWPVKSPAYFKKDTSQGGVLMDIGVHLLDLMQWWFGEPAEIFYADDAMGGVEVNCWLHCKFAQGFTGKIRLSRDCQLPNRYLIRCSKGWIMWEVNNAGTIKLGFTGAQLALKSKIYQTNPGKPDLTADKPCYNFEQSFASQIINVVDALQGKQSLLVPAEEGIKSLKLIEYCYQHRHLMHTPWLNERELITARLLNQQS
ncbi:MAG: Gfo/Idh/MocA family protein [Candidatus Loosdrechtia sp.]|uniref:Gfo/Idh/MocA family protein n=1 Tax=Candidatus Loosdrechtia sp. TaxID=3101272 RepID=UPI003A62A3E3|nr:MAG: Gfo/Idh/MocA family oxidoreductase [Candidatus Jettenia sp. AMX2]